MPAMSWALLGAAVLGAGVGPQDSCLDGVEEMEVYQCTCCVLVEVWKLRRLNWSIWKTLREGDLRAGT